MDGGAHLYNANIIKHLLFSKAGLIDEFYTFNSYLIPNWTGHILLTFFVMIFPSFIAEKIFLLCYVIFLPISFRLLVKTLSLEILN